MIHILYKYDGKFYQHHKEWDFYRAERVLERLRAEYWEIVSFEDGR